jgi:hypothetical protein
MLRMARDANYLHHMAADVIDGVRDADAVLLSFMAQASRGGTIRESGSRDKEKFPSPQHEARVFFSLSSVHICPP